MCRRRNDSRVAHQPASSTLWRCQPLIVTECVGIALDLDLVTLTPARRMSMADRGFPHPSASGHRFASPLRRRRRPPSGTAGRRPCRVRSCRSATSIGAVATAIPCTVRISALPARPSACSTIWIDCLKPLPSALTIRPFSASSRRTAEAHDVPDNVRGPIRSDVRKLFSANECDRRRHRREHQREDFGGTAGVDACAVKARVALCARGCQRCGLALGRIDRPDRADDVLAGP